MKKRAYKKSHGGLMGTAAWKAGLTRNGCAAYSLARAIGDPDDDRSAAEWLPVVIGLLRDLYDETGRIGLDLNGTCRRTVSAFRAVMADLGITIANDIKPEMQHFERAYPWERHHEKVCEDVTAHTYDAHWGPTVARFLSDNPQISRALIFTRGHVAFVDQQRVYGATARHRVIRALVLTEQGGDR